MLLSFSLSSSIFLSLKSQLSLSTALSFFSFLFSFPSLFFPVWFGQRSSPSSLSFPLLSFLLSSLSQFGLGRGTAPLFLPSSFLSFFPFSLSFSGLHECREQIAPCFIAMASSTAAAWQQLTFSPFISLSLTHIVVQS